MIEKKKSWKEIPIGGMITEAGNASKYMTGGWRIFRPEKNKIKCINCLFCWIYCPDSSIIVKDEKMVGFDYEHCKGCGICAKVCPVKCIDMKREEK
ncbi:MAG: 4Fe-4S binding protein [Candidatus Omnitrophica bacterium]|nr:4Fe-4S binding protein [Candidatus Omnitrophota bacterium]MBU1852646.1 4Fe-4S binding protein [Candidatus Omnitrophota bacterium]